MSKIKILYKKESYQVEIGNISPENLQECFDLQKPPTILLDENKNKMINYKHWRSKLNVGSIYRIKEQGNTSVNPVKDNVDEEKKAKKTTEMDESFRGIVLHSLIASTAVYKMEHKNGDEKLIKQYMYEQMNNHFFDYIIPSKHGENFYLISKEANVNRIYVAFRGTSDLLDLKYKLQVTLCNFFSFIFFTSSFTKQSSSPLITKDIIDSSCRKQLKQKLMLNVFSNRKLLMMLTLSCV